MARQALSREQLRHQIDDARRRAETAKAVGDTITHHVERVKMLNLQAQLYPMIRDMERT